MSDNKEKVNERAKRFRENNRDKINEIAKKYREKNKGKIKIAHKKWQINNKKKVREMQNKWRKENRERIAAHRRKKYAENINDYREKQLEKHRKLRMMILEHYGGSPPECACCGESYLEFLTMDHINGGGTKQRKQLRGTSFYRWLKKNNYPDEYRVLCMNCNFALGHSGYCPHQKEVAKLTIVK